MKKLIALLMVLLMIVPAAAEETGEEEDYQSVTWEAMLEQSGMDQLAEQGDFTEMEILGTRLKMWIPGNMKQVEDPDYLYKFATEDESALCCVQVEELPEELTDMDEIVDYLEEVADWGEVTRTALNDMACLDFSTDDGRDAVLLFTGDGQAVSFIFTPMTNEDYIAVARLMGASLQKVD